MIDCNVYLSQWPFRRLPLDKTQLLVEHLQSVGVDQAWCGSFDALLHTDQGAVNHRLAEECSRFGKQILVPFGVVNPLLPDWREELRRCHEVHHMPGIRVHPNYHRYGLDHAEFAQLLDEATRRKMIVQIPLTMEDERTQHPLLRVPHVDPAPLIDLVSRVRDCRVVLINAFRAMKPAMTEKLSMTARVWFDIAMLEGVAGVENLLKRIGPEKILLGSYAPFFYWESCDLKLREAELAEPHRRAIRRDNALGLRNWN